MSQEEYPEDTEDAEGQDEFEDQEEFETGLMTSGVGAAWYGRLLGLLIVVGGLALGAKIASDANQNEFWIFLQVVLTPVGVGFLILVAAEGLQQLGNRRS